jgi:hypothetical protein
MIKIMAYTLLVLLGFFSSLVLAEGGAYQIELMVFSQAMPNTEVFEQTQSQIKWPSDLTELSGYKQSDNTTLDDSYAALSKNSTYRPILHVAWIQPIEGGALSAPVHIPAVKLDGYVQLQQGQGLQMTVDLEFVGNPDSDLGSAVIYRLNEKRSIKLNEVYYLDHPKFGVVIKVTPI